MLLHIFEKNSIYTHILNLYTFSRAIDLPTYRGTQVIFIKFFNLLIALIVINTLYS